MSKESTQNERLNEIVSPFRKTKVERYDPAVFTDFDTTRPNFHDSKAEFLEEKDLVKAAIENTHALLHVFLSGVWGKDEHANVAKKIASIIEDRSRARLRDSPIREPSDVVRKSAAEVGLPRVAAVLIWEIRFELTARMTELENQEAVYWSQSSRPPKYYARTIALRFAKFIARQSGHKPTIGTSRDGDYPSTDYGRALEEIFKTLGVQGHFKRAGQWAIDQLTEEDLRPTVAVRGGPAFSTSLQPC